MDPATASAVPLQGEGAVPAPASENPLTVSVLICTSGRGASAVETIQSILRSTGPFCELLVIDQSADDRTEKALRSFLTDTRLRYIRTATRGKGIALNIGLEAAQGEVLAITDDDCTVDADWPRGLVEVFERYPQVAVVYGT
ncbi:MAG: glycosyltransferase family A protein, partial [Chloroherpetonaceae bacterium]|nr:glycosyltransferase [Chthonomonadaceae bacterium]MDW8209303.1 glycosyltransferase family A protein [Chloroherpetonaceae bacterium]